MMKIMLNKQDSWDLIGKTNTTEVGFCEPASGIVRRNINYEERFNIFNVVFSTCDNNF